MSTVNGFQDPLRGFDGILNSENLDCLAKEVRRLSYEVARLETELHAERTQVKELERGLKTKRLRIGALKADREEEVFGSPERQQDECVHKLWKAACKRGRPLHVSDRENMGAAVKKLG